MPFSSTDKAENEKLGTTSKRHSEEEEE